MAGEVIRVDGLRELARDLKAIDEDLPKELKKAGKDAAELVADTARLLVPVVTGRLKAAIRTGSTLRSATVKAGTQRRAPYAPLIHFGAVRDKRTGRRRNIAPNPFLYTALDRRRGDVVDAYQAQLVKYLNAELS